MKKIAVVLVLYLAQAFYTYGTLTAECDYRDHNELHFSHVTQRDELGFTVIVPVVPVGFIVAAVESNFNQHGWELTWKTP